MLNEGAAVVMVGVGLTVTVPDTPPPEIVNGMVIVAAVPPTFPVITIGG